MEVLLKLKPDPNQDNLSGLLGCAAISASLELIQHLLRIGAKPNDKANGGASALERCPNHLGFEDFDAFLGRRQASRYALRGTLECIQASTEHGALWRPDDRVQTNSLRQTLLKCEPAVTVDLVKVLVRNEACSEERLEHARTELQA
jgi:hypothetical protein